jgi:N-hydroxyarylamine O-acetyltransferase
MSSNEVATAVDVNAYLERIGVAPDTVIEPDRETLARLQAAHVQRVPFENLAIVGDPHPDAVPDDCASIDAVPDDCAPIDAEGVVLDTTHLQAKVVERERGGYCFELNGLFHSLLATLGYDVDRVAARVVGSDGDDTPPANHHANVVHLDERFVVDVGMGTPQMRRPTPVDGTEVTDDVGVTWRVVASDRVDATHETQYREPHEGDWTTRYVFDDDPRTLEYFAATNEFLQSSPASPFTGDPVVSIATADGYRRLDADTQTLVTYDDIDERDATDTDEHDGTGARRGDAPVAETVRRERPVQPDDWHAVLAASFGIDVADDD